MPEAILYTAGKPDNAGGPLQGSTYTWKPVYAGGLIVSIREGRQSGRPGDKHTVKYMEAGPGLRHCGIHLGTLCDAGGPLVEFTYTWKLVYAGGLLVCIWEARQSGRPAGKFTVRYMEAGPSRRPSSRSPGEALSCGRPPRSIYIHMEGCLCGRPYCVYMGSPTEREAR